MRKPKVDNDTKYQWRCEWDYVAKVQAIKDAIVSLEKTAASRRNDGTMHPSEVTPYLRYLEALQTVSAAHQGPASVEAYLRLQEDFKLLRPYIGSNSDVVFSGAYPYALSYYKMLNMDRFRTHPDLDPPSEEWKWNKWSISITLACMVVIPLVIGYCNS